MEGFEPGSVGASLVDVSSTRRGSHRTQQSMVLLGETGTKCTGPEDGASKPCSEAYRRVNLADHLLVRKGDLGVWG